MRTLLLRQGLRCTTARSCKSRRESRDGQIKYPDRFEFAGPLDAATVLLNDYDSVTDRWQSLETSSDYWAAIRLGHNLGKRGSGRTVAILDSAVDQTIPRLQERISANKQQLGGEPGPHGTAVAILISTVAPDADLNTYEVAKGNRPSRKAVMASLEAVFASEAAVVNLSFGDPQSLPATVANHGDMPQAFGGADATSRCPSGVCLLTERLDSRGKKVVAAAGNTKGEIYCPARSPRAVASGFLTFERTSITTEGGRWMDVVKANPPSYDQSDLLAHTIQQPPNAVGSSFSTPLLAGAIAIMSDIQDFDAFMLACMETGKAQALLADEADGLTPTNEQLEAAWPHFIRAFELLPHAHETESDPKPCYECSMFAQSLYTDFGRHLLNFSQFEEAKKALATVAAFAPWSADAHANLGAVHLAEAEVGRQPKRALLEMARACYSKAASRRPESRMLREMRLDIETRLASTRD